MQKHTWNGRTWAYAGGALGGLVSIGANAAHSYLPPSGAPGNWRPPLGAVVGAVFWPVALFVAIEILARTAWPCGSRWLAVRLTGLVPVAVVAATVSYNHLSGLLAHYGEDRLTVLLGPLAVDGLMVMSSAAVIAGAPRTTTTARDPAPGAAPDPAPDPAPGARPDRVAEPARQRRRLARKGAPGKRTEEQLLAEARFLNEAALRDKGVPVSKRALKGALHVGQPTANRIHAVLANDREDGSQ